MFLIFQLRIHEAEWIANETIFQLAIMVKAAPTKKLSLMFLVIPLEFEQVCAWWYTTLCRLIEMEKDRLLCERK